MPPEDYTDEQGEINLEDLLEGLAEGEGSDIFFDGLSPESPVGAGGFGGWTPGTETTVGQQLQHFYRINPAYVKELQAVLFAGGFYGANAELSDIQWGQYDEATFGAWATVVERAARFWESSGGIGAPSINDILKEAAESAGLDPAQLEDLGREVTGLGPEDVAALDTDTEVVSREGNLINIILSDPNELRLTMDRVAQGVLGRKANADEQRLLIGYVHALQREGQTAQQTAEPGRVFTEVPAGVLEGAGISADAAMALEDSLPDPEDVTVEVAPPSPESAAELLLRQENPAESGAHDIAIQYANFLDLLGGQVRFPRTTIGGDAGGGQVGGL